MSVIELLGRVNEQGQLEFEPPANLPPGEVQITIRTISDEEIAADEARWDEQFADSQDALERMAEEALAEHEAGLTEEFDPDNDPDMP